MKTESAKRQFEVAEAIALGLYDIEIINPLQPINRGEALVPCLILAAPLIAAPDDTFEQYGSSCMDLHLSSKSGGHVNKMGETRHFFNQNDWLMRGERTLAYRKGDSQDCAAAAACLLLLRLPPELMNIKIEVVTSDNHTFIIVNREGGLDALNTWGDNVFFIDIWYQNQFPKNTVKGVYWAQGYDAFQFQFLAESVKAMTLDIVLRDHT